MNKELIELEDNISKMIYSDNGRTTHFSYTNKDNIYNVSVYTYNRINKETFLLYKSSSDSYSNCLEKVIQYLSLGKSRSYTVNWSRIDRSIEIQKSYFYCTDIEDVLYKFFEGKDKNLYIIYEIKMNPIS
jgi:hypothetical protein